MRGRPCKGDEAIANHAKRGKARLSVLDDALPQVVDLAVAHLLDAVAERLEACLKLRAERAGRLVAGALLPLHEDARRREVAVELQQLLVVGHGLALQLRDSGVRLLLGAHHRRELHVHVGKAGGRGLQGTLEDGKLLLRLRIPRLHALEARRDVTQGGLRLADVLRGARVLRLLHLLRQLQRFDLTARRCQRLLDVLDSFVAELALQLALLQLLLELLDILLQLLGALLGHLLCRLAGVCPLRQGLDLRGRGGEEASNGK